MVSTGQFQLQVFGKRLGPPALGSGQYVTVSVQVFGKESLPTVGSGQHVTVSITGVC